MGPKSWKLLIWWKSLPEGGRRNQLGVFRKEQKARGLEWERKGSAADEVGGRAETRHAWTCRGTSSGRRTPGFPGVR